MSYRQALIPAAGRGTRLDRPNTPKPLVDVGGEALVVRLLGQLEAIGVEKAIIVLGHARKVLERALTHHPRVNLDLEFVYNESWEDGLAGSVLMGRGLFDQPFVLAMADHFFDEAIARKMARVNLHKDALAVLVDDRIERVHDISSAVKVVLEADRVLSSGRELQTYNAVDAGLFVATPEFLDALDRDVHETGDRAGLSGAINRLARDGRVRAVRTEELRWFDIDTPIDVISAEMTIRKALRSGRTQSATGPKPHDRAVEEYTFTTGKPSQTRVSVLRGFVRDPRRLEIVPPASASSPLFVFTDRRVNELYGDDFVGGLESQGYNVHRVVMSEGEESKTLANYTQLVEQVLAKGIDEQSVLISLGGGAVCNVCGFIASTLYRGIGLIHVPTTLMAQCDAAISHKQGVNGERGKNLVGSYYAPLAIAVDVDVLATLEDWLIPDGLAEVIKHALGQDIEYLEYLLAYDGDPRNPDFLEYVVRKNIELKCVLMAQDPKEHREGMVLQYGHTVGHPIEYLSGYEISHGQAVAIGMVAAANVARILGACDSATVDIHRKVLAHYGLPVSIPANIEDDAIVAMMRYNKRYLTEGTRMALIDRPGHLWSVAGEYTIPVSDQVLREALIATRVEHSI